MSKFIIFLVALKFLCISLQAQELSDFKTPKKFIKFTNNEDTYEIETKVHYNGESILLYINNKLEVILTDILFIRNQFTEGVNCKAYHATCTTDKKRYLILIAEDNQFFFVHINENEYIFLTNKDVINENKTSSNLEHSCYHSDLSDQFDLGVMFNRMKETEYADRTVYVSIAILSKHMAMQSDFIELKSPKYSFYSSTFSGCDRVSSFSKNKFIEDFGYDNFAGDIVIADFNFDGLDDIAVVREVSNRSEFYNFYIQNADLKFSYDEFLTERIGQIPRQIDFVKKEYRNVESIGAWGYRETKFRFNSSSKKWEVHSEEHEY